MTGPLDGIARDWHKIYPDEFEAAELAAPPLIRDSRITSTTKFPLPDRRATP